LKQFAAALSPWGVTLLPENAPFKTKKIYEMPGGIANGAAAAQLPDRYAPADPANQVAVGVEN